MSPISTAIATGGPRIAIFSAMRSAFQALGRSGELGDRADARSFADMLELLGVSEQLAMAAKYER